MNGIENTKKEMPILKNIKKLDPLASTRDKSFTIQNALFGAMQITKNATDNDKNNYK